MNNLDELEDYVPSAEIFRKVSETNDKMYVLRETDKVNEIDDCNLGNLFEDADIDSKGKYLIFKYPTSCGNVTAYEGNSEYILLVHKDGRKAIICVYELRGVFAFKNMIIIHGHETIDIVETTDFTFHREHTR